MLVSAARRAAVVGLGALLLGGCLELKAENGSSGAGGGGGAGAGGGSAVSSSAAAGSHPCIDTLNDPENCGACGHGCLGGSCNAGVCGPVMLHLGEKQAEQYAHLALDADSVYWSVNGAILALPKTTRGEIAPTVLSTTAGADFIAVDAKALYYTTPGAGGQIVVLDKNAGGGNSQALAPTEYNPAGLTAFNGKLYWANHGPDRAVRTIGNMGPSGTATNVAGMQSTPFFVAADGSGIYWTYISDGTADTGGVNKAGEAAPFATSLYAPSSLALDENSIYALERDGSLVTMNKLSPGQRTSVKNSSGEIVSGRVVVDGSYVYWTGPGTQSCPGGKSCPCSISCGNIYRKPKIMGPPEIVAKGDWGNVVDLAIDGQAIYWTTGSDARLMRIAKPLP